MRRPFAFLLFLLTGCALVLEDRSGCPCQLSLDLKNLPAAPVQVEVTGMDFLFRGAADRDTVLVVPVPRTGVSVTAVFGGTREGDGTIRIPYGDEAPPLYLFAGQADTSGDEAWMPVCPHKEYCRLDMQFTGPPGVGPPFEVEILGSVDGWEKDGTPSEGPFSCRFHPEGDGSAAVLLPRQRDESLRMQIVFEGRPVCTMALGTYIARSGYDWTEEDLEDVSLEIDISVTAITFRLGSWQDTERRDFLI